MTVDRKLLERIKKLHDHAESAKAIGNEQEALTFAAAVAKMLEKYELDMSDLEFEEHQKEEPIKSHWLTPEAAGRKAKKRAQTWESLLAQVVAKAHNCDIIHASERNSVLLIGRRTNRVVAEYMIVVMWHTAEKLADKAYVQEFYRCRNLGDVTLARGFRKAFLTGFVHKIQQRYEQERKQTEQAYAKNPHALLRLSNELALVTQVGDTIHNSMENPITVPFTSKIKHPGGYVQGAQAAEKVALRGTGLGSGEVGQTKAIPGAPRLLGGGS